MVGSCDEVVDWINVIRSIWFDYGVLRAAEVGAEMQSCIDGRATDITVGRQIRARRYDNSNGIKALP